MAINLSTKFRISGLTIVFLKFLVGTNAFLCNMYCILFSWKQTLFKTNGRMGEFLDKLWIFCEIFV